MKIKIVSIDEANAQPILEVNVVNGKKTHTFHIIVGDNFSEENLKGIVKQEMAKAVKVESGTELAKSLVGKEITI